MDGSPFDAHLRAWGLTLDGEAIATPSSWLAPVRDGAAPAMLKVFKPGSDEAASAAVLRWFAGDGAVALIRADAGGLLLERAEAGPGLVGLALAGGDTAAAGILADTIARLHAPRPAPAPEGLKTLRRWFAALFRQEATLPILRRGAAIARDLLAAPQAETVLHGDIHHGNVLASPRGWLAIDPKGLFGERAYEVANLLGNPVPHAAIVLDAGRMRHLAELCGARLGLEPARLLRFALAHAGLSASWHIEAGQDPSFRLATAAVLDGLVPGE